MSSLGPSRTRGQKCLLMSKNCHHNEKPSATGLFTKGQNLVADGQTSKMPSTTSGAGQTETNLGKQKRGCFVSEMIWQVICSSPYAIDFAVKLITFSFPNNMNPAQAKNTFRRKCNNFDNIHPPLPSPYILNDWGNSSQSSPSTTTSDSLPESLLFSEDSSIPGSTSLRRTYSSVKNKKAQGRWSKEEETLLVQLWTEKHGFAENRAALKAWPDVLFIFCSQVRL